MEPEDGGSPAQAALRELREELSIEPSDVTLRPIEKLSTRYSGVNGESGDLLVHMFMATLVSSRSLHAYEGSGIRRIDQASLPEIIDLLDLTPSAYEVLTILRDVLNNG